jgi:excisionase family DNA binding protein
MSSREESTFERLAVSVEEAAAMSGLGRTTIYLALGEGSLRSLKVGKRRLIRVEALKAWMAAHETAPAKVES